MPPALRLLGLLVATTLAVAAPAAAPAKEKPAPPAARGETVTKSDPEKPGEHAGDDDDDAADADNGASSGKPASPGHSGGTSDADNGASSGKPASPGHSGGTSDAASGSSGAEPPRGQPEREDAKIDARLAAVAEANPQARLRVLVLGADAGAAVGDAAGSVRTPLDGIAGAGAVVSASELDELAAQNGVSYVMLDVSVMPTAEPETLGATSAFAELDGAPTAWRRGLSGRGVGIAVIDSGVAAVPDFGPRRLVRVRLDAQREIEDTFGHGTFVAAIAAGGGPGVRGVAPGATVYGINVARPDGVYTSDVIAGLGWVLRNHRRLGIRVVTLSLSETEPSSYLANPLDTVIERLWRDGVVVVVSAGNGGPGAALYAPANDPFAIAVGALDSDGRPAPFSTSGTTPDGVAKPDLLAPGRRIVSALPLGTTLAGLAPPANRVAPGYAFMSGTSMSAPQVAGAAAVLLQQHPRWTPDQVKWVLRRTARPLAAPVGALDLARAVTYASRPRSANPATARARFGLDGSTAALRTLRDEQMPVDSSAFDGNSWNGNSWNGNSWNGNSWNANSWN